MAFAESTEVPVEKTRAEIDKLLKKHGSRSIASAVVDTPDRQIATLQFVIRDRSIRFVTILPGPKPYARSPTGQTRTEKSRQAAWEQGGPTWWRGLLLCLKAKLEAVESGLVLFEEEFMAQTVDPESGATLGNLLLPTFQKRLEGKPVILALPAPA